jgi:hypothetical protein
LDWRVFGEKMEDSIPIGNIPSHAFGTKDSSIGKAKEYFLWC